MKFKLRDFKKIFQIIKIVKFEIHLKKKKIANFQVLESSMVWTKKAHRSKNLSRIGRKVEMSRFESDSILRL